MPDSRQIIPTIDPARLPSALTIDDEVTTAFGPMFDPQVVAVELLRALDVESLALERGDGQMLTAVDHGRRLEAMRQQQAAPRTMPTPTGYRFESLHLHLVRPRGQGGLRLAATASGTVTDMPIVGSDRLPRRPADASRSRSYYEPALTGDGSSSMHSNGANESRTRGSPERRVAGFDRSHRGRPHLWGNSMIDSTMTLADGRELAYAELGSPTGPLVFYFHGAPGSRLEVAGMDEDFARNSVRVVSPERPGCGRSSPQPGRRRPDWARDVTQLADHLGHRRFAVCGMSSGGPYAITCAALLPDRVVAAAVVAGVTDIAWPGFFEEYAKAWPDLVELMGCGDEVAGKAWCDRHFGADGAGFPGQAPPMGRADRSFLRDAARAEPFLGSMRESFRQGTGGFAQEIMLEGQPWEFDPAAITAPVRVLHGETDGMCPIGHSRRTAEMIPSATLEVIPEHGHLSIMTELPAIAANLAVLLR